MAKRRKRPVNRNDTLKLVELQCGIIQHMAALKAVTQFLIDGKKEAAVARLDQAVTAIGALVRGQAVGITAKCPSCESEQAVVAWVDDGKCRECGAALNIETLWGRDDTDD